MNLNTVVTIEQANNGRKFKLPHYETVFMGNWNKFRFDPRVDDWVKHCHEWSGIAEDNWINIASVKDFAAMFYSFCDDIERYENIVKVYMLFFILDDHTECKWGDVARDKAKSDLVWDQIIEGCDGLLGKDISMKNWKPYTVYCHLVLEDVCRQLNDCQRKRLARLWIDYAMATKVETQKLSVRYRFKNLQEIIQVKLGSQALYCAFQLLEYSDNIQLTEEEWDDPKFQDILLVYNRAGIMANDVVSFEKEFSDQCGQLECMYNVVALMVVLENCSIDEAMNRTTQLMADYEKKSIELFDKHVTDSSFTKNQMKICERIQYLLAGNYHGGIVLDRYN